jgi:RHS repeat-associated protein
LRGIFEHWNHLHATSRLNSRLFYGLTPQTNGNRLSFTGPNGTLNATYDAQDRLTQYADTTYAYTPNGELSRKTDGTRITSYDYDGASKLVGVTLPDGTRIEYLLDGRGRRMGRKVNGVLGQAFLYQDRLRPIAELDGAAQVVARFVYGGNVPAYMIKGGATYRIITDPIGSPRLVVDVATGQVMQRIDYDEFGRVLLDSNPGFQPFGFAGGLYDPLSGLVHFGAREYDAEIGRWTTKDPVGVSSGLNVYAYVKNNPVNLIDPVGFGPELIAPRVQLNPSWDPGVQVDPVPHSPAPDARVAAPEPQPNPVGPSGAPPTPRPFEIVSHGPDQPLEVFEYGPSAEPAPPAEPLPSGPTPQPPCGGGFRLTPANSVPLVFAFLFGLQAGRELNQQYDLSGKAANLGVDYRDALLDIGVPEQDADVAGGLTSIIAGASLGAASVGIPFFTDLLDD